MSDTDARNVLRLMWTLAYNFPRNAISLRDPRRGPLLAAQEEALVLYQRLVQEYPPAGDTGGTK